MRGPEDLRELIAHMYTFVKLKEIMMSSYLVEHPDSASKRLKDVLTDMTDNVEQIEREQCGHVSRMRVLAVITDMERHVSGAEGMEDSPVARWARELREALGGEGHDHAADTTVSAYDLLPQEDREAITWVRAHGGLGAVTIEHSNLWGTVNETRRRLGVDRAGDLTADAQAIWRKVDRLKSLLGESVPRAAYERHLARRQRQIDESHAALRRRNARIAELERERDELRAQVADMRPRLMPEDKEWPKYKDGAPVNFDDTVTDPEGFELKVKSVEFHPNGFTLHGEFDQKHWYEDDDRFDYPAPKVLDADGVEIREKRDAWWICEGDERGVHAERLRVETIGPNGLIECSPYNGGTWVYLEPSELYVNKPVPASDGRPLREGETVWLNEMGLKSKLVDRGEPLKVVAFDKKGNVGVLDRDGIVLGETSPWWFSPSCLTHERPDSWKLLEEDAAKNPFDYCKDVGHRLDTCENSEAYKARDLVRRARALAGDA